MESKCICVVLIYLVAGCVYAKEQTCVLKLNEGTFIISSGAVYVAEVECANYYCEPIKFSLDPNQKKPKMMKFSTACPVNGVCVPEGSTYIDELCYRKKCVLREKEDGTKMAEFLFIGTAKLKCKAADNTCKPAGSKFFPCFYQDQYESFCKCVKSGKISYLKNMLSYDAKRVGTQDGNSNGSFCFFPFKYRGKTHRTCIPSANRTSWCATSPYYDTDKRWGNCVESPSYQFTGEGLTCKFPFMFNNTLHHRCIDGGRPGKHRPWCGTKFLADGGERPRTWDYCEDDAML